MTVVRHLYPCPLHNFCTVPTLSIGFLHRCFTVRNGAILPPGFRSRGAVLICCECPAIRNFSHTSVALQPSLLQDDWSQKSADRAVCKAFSEKKIRNVKKWREKHFPNGPPHDLVFVGDNGEGDAEAAAEMLKHDLIQHAFIRRVARTDRGFFHEKPPADIACPNLHYFDDYADAARQARGVGLLSEQARHRVEEAVRSAPPEKPSEHWFFTSKAYDEESKAAGFHGFYAPSFDKHRHK